MAKKVKFEGLPPNTFVDLVGFSKGKRTIIENITIVEAEQKIQDLKKEKNSKGEKKWKDWRFQTFQKGFVK